MHQWTTCQLSSGRAHIYTACKQLSSSSPFSLDLFFCSYSPSAGRVRAHSMCCTLHLITISNAFLLNLAHFSLCVFSLSNPPSFSFLFSSHAVVSRSLSLSSNVLFSPPFHHTDCERERERGKGKEKLERGKQQWKQRKING